MAEQRKSGDSKIYKGDDLTKRNNPQERKQRNKSEPWEQREKSEKNKETGGSQNRSDISDRKPIGKKMPEETDEDE